MEIAAFASFLVLIIAWLVLPLRASAALAVGGEAAPAVVNEANGADVQASAAAA